MSNKNHHSTMNNLQNQKPINSQNQNIPFQTLNPQNNPIQQLQKQNQTMTMNPQDLKKKQNIIIPNIVETNGNKPLPRYGHSLVSISSVKLILFGGAVGDIKNYKCSNEVFIYNLMTKIWIKVNYSNMEILPKERAAHAATSTNNNQMFIHGGSIGGSGLAEDELWLFDMNITNNNNNNQNNENNENNDHNNNNFNEEQIGKWKLIKVTGPSPGKRYGHTLNNIQQYLILIGGNSISGLSNDIWMIDITQKELNWQKIETENKEKIPKLHFFQYHKLQ